MVSANNPMKQHKTSYMMLPSHGYIKPFCMVFVGVETTKCEKSQSLRVLVSGEPAKAYFVL